MAFEYFSMHRFCSALPIKPEQETAKEKEVQEGPVRLGQHVGPELRISEPVLQRHGHENSPHGEKHEKRQQNRPVGAQGSDLSFDDVE